MNLTRDNLKSLAWYLSGTARPEMSQMTDSGEMDGYLMLNCFDEFTKAQLDYFKSWLLGKFGQAALLEKIVSDMLPFSLDYTDSYDKDGTLNVCVEIAPWRDEAESYHGFGLTHVEAFTSACLNRAEFAEANS